MLNNIKQKNLNSFFANICDIGLIPHDHVTFVTFATVQHHRAYVAVFTIVTTMQTFLPQCNIIGLQGYFYNLSPERNLFATV